MAGRCFVRRDPPASGKRRVHEPASRAITSGVGTPTSRACAKTFSPHPGTMAPADARFSDDHGRVVANLNAVCLVQPANDEANEPLDLAAAD